jgi:putative ABC transport system ATP-binding protein
MVALLGPSGMGKTTVLRLMAGIMIASAGAVRVADRDIGQLRLADRRKLLAREISYVVQDTMSNVLPFATVAENLWFAQHGAKARGHIPRWSPEWLLDYLGLTSLAGARVATLPMGMQQQVAIASGVAAGPRLLLADEPTGQLTAAATAEVIRLLYRVNESGTTVVIVTHDISIAGRFPRAITIRDGRVGTEVRSGEVYGVIDSGGTVQLPPDVLERLRPNSRIRILHTETGVELRDPGPEANRRPTGGGPSQRAPGSASSTHAPDGGVSR